MRYADEEILAKREERKKEKYCTIETGIYMDGKIVQFERKELMEKFSILIPSVIQRMPLEFARVKYPSEFRPQLIMTTLDLSVNFGFTVFPKEISCENLKPMIERIMAAIYRSNPDYRIYPIQDLKDVQGKFFSFRSHAMDSDLFNMSLVASVGGQFVQGSFNCYYQEYQKWKNIAVNMWETIENLKEEDYR